MNTEGRGIEGAFGLRPEGLSGRGILIIDDDLDFAESLRDLLQADGCSIGLITDETTLDDPMTRFSAEIVLLDVRLKQANGIDLMDRLQTLWPDARIIVMTGYASKHTAIEALKHGAFDCLEKPLHPDELRNTIERALWAYDADTKMRDAQARMQDQARIQESPREAEAAKRSESLFRANMSHELRPPLNAILGFSDAIGEERFGPLSPPAYRDHAESIHGSGNDGLPIVYEVLDPSRIGLDTKALNEEPLEIADVLDETLGMVEVAARKRDITINRTISPGLPRLLADRRMVKQMLINLLSNAVKFTRPGGRIGALVSRDDKGNLLIEVGDNGIGIESDKIGSVLEPLSIAEPVESRKHGGVGLGLAIAKRLVERHDGRLDLRSQKDVGTIVTLVFPANRIGIRT